MKMLATLFLAVLGATVFTATAAAEVKSLRGDELSAMAKKTEKTQIMEVSGGIERSYKQQPPMVPHAVDKYQIDLKANACLDCHSEATYQMKNAPKIGDSHYRTRDGKLLQSVSGRRYFCNQCHTPQMNTAPLVGNNFQGAK
jgi:cytochrome c-type protein NapB